MKRKATVVFEEHLVKQITIDIPDEVSEADELEYAELKAKEMYKNQEIVLTADDFDGDALIEVSDSKGNCTDWISIK